jgi:hypothetical protein
MTLLFSRDLGVLANKSMFEISEDKYHFEKIVDNED